MLPKVGITASVFEGKLALNEQYVKAALMAGAVPYAVPPIPDPRTIEQYVREMDGWIVSGGADVDPVHYGEQPLPELGPVLPDRDRFEIGLIREAAKKNVPVIAVCRGLQVLNVALGGSLYQDVRHYRSDHLQHQQKSAPHIASHAVEIVPHSLLHSILNKSEIRTNSLHHQSVKSVAPGLFVSARAPDGVVEAVESRSHRFVLGVQWHPEAMAAADDDAMKLFLALTDACGPNGNPSIEP